MNLPPRSLVMSCLLGSGCAVDVQGHQPWSPALVTSPGHQPWPPALATNPGYQQVAQRNTTPRVKEASPRIDRSRIAPWATARMTARQTRALAGVRVELEAASSSD